MSKKASKKQVNKDASALPPGGDVDHVDDTDDEVKDVMTNDQCHGSHITVFFYGTLHNYSQLTTSQRNQSSWYHGTFPGEQV